MASLDSIITFSTLAALVQLCIIIGVILRVMLTRHPPGSSFAWILVTTLLPYFGFILYLLFGERPIGQIRATRFRRHLARLKELSHQKLTPTGPLPRHLARHRTLIHLATRMGNLPVTSGTEIVLLSSSDDTFAAIIRDINSARHSIDMEFYIWHPGGEADRVAASLFKARERGVRVRILVDDFGARTFLRSETCRAFRHAGIDVAKAMPMRLLHFFGLQRVDLRLHRKTIIIDNEIGYTGSLNMIDPHTYDAASTVGPWVDAMVRLTGPAVQSLRATFQIDWAIQPDGDPSDLERVHAVRKIPQFGNATIVTVPSGPYGHQDPNLYLLLDAINAARFNITITTPYFVPNEGLATALLSAAYRGVKITLIVPSRADSWAVTWAARRYFDDMLAAGVSILLYNGGLLHTKSISVDDEYAVFGTVNFDNRSIHLNFEMMLLIFDTDFIQDIKKLQDSYAEQCSRLDPGTLRNRPMSERLKEGACYLISPLL